MTELNIEYAPKTGNEELDPWNDRLVEYLRKYLSQPFDRGDPAGFDWNETDLTMDGTWRDLDCSSVVPEDAVAIIFNLWVKDASVSTNLGLRKNGNSNAFNYLSVRTQVANVWTTTQGIVACDTSRVVEYFASSAFDDVGIGISGWFK